MRKVPADEITTTEPFGEKILILRIKEKEMSAYRWTFPLLAAFLVLGGKAHAHPSFVSEGYMQSFHHPTQSQVPWSDLTHIIEAFAGPGSNGTVTPSGQVSGYVAMAHSNGVRYIVSIGGAGASDTTWESDTTTYETTFISNIMAFVEAGDGTKDSNGNPNSYDGIDIDWEFPTSAEQTTFSQFLQDLATALHATQAYDGNPRSLSFYTDAGGDYYSGGPSPICGVNWSQAATVVDFCNIGVYDEGCVPSGGPTFNAPLSVLSPACAYSDCSSANRVADMENDVARLQGLGFPDNKMVIGIPMYTDYYVGYSSTPYTDDQVFPSGVSLQYYTPESEATYSYNPGSGAITLTMDVAQSFCDKMNWAFSQNPPLGGVMVWELGYALSGNSTETAIFQVMGGQSCVTPPPTPTPTNTYTPTPTFTPTMTPTPCLNARGTPCATNTFTPVPFSNPVVFPNPSTHEPAALGLPSGVTSVDIKVFTLAFRKVQEIQPGQYVPGTTVPLPMTDSGGAPLANGLYYLVVTTNQGTTTVKWLILR
jgi:hypothetical protein